jgi:uncharacterized protein
LPKRSPRTAKTVSERSPARRLWFFDASAVAKAYLGEAQTPDVRRWMTERRVVIGRLSVVEVASAIHRRARQGELDPAARDEAIRALLGDLPEWDVVELTDTVATRAIGLVARHHLRAGDAIQLASALVVYDGGAEDFGRFIAYDARLLNAAREEGLPIADY